MKVKYRFHTAAMLLFSAEIINWKKVVFQSIMIKFQEPHQVFSSVTLYSQVHVVTVLML
jgi:hypothetical protein